jgi:hypothetical protein
VLATLMGSSRFILVGLATLTGSSRFILVGLAALTGSSRLICFLDFGGGLRAEMFRGAKEKVRFSDPPQVRFSDLEKLPADQL